MADDHGISQGQIKDLHLASAWQVTGREGTAHSKPSAFAEYLKCVQHSMQILVRGKNP